jgi:hypothetical protein
VQVLRDRRARLLDGARIAPSQTGTIEPASARELRNLLLKKQVRIAWSRPSGIQNYSWRSLARAKDVQRTPANVHRSSNLREPLPVLPFANLLVRNACQNHRGE